MALATWDKVSHGEEVPPAGIDQRARNALTTPEDLPPCVSASLSLVTTPPSPVPLCLAAEQPNFPACPVTPVGILKPATQDPSAPLAGDSVTRAAPVYPSRETGARAPTTRSSWNKLTITPHAPLEPALSVTSVPIKMDISPVGHHVPPPATADESSQPFQKRGRWNNTLVYSGTHLRPALQEVFWSERVEDPESCALRRAVLPLGGLRQLAGTMSRLPLVREAGSLVYMAIRAAMTLTTRPPLLLPTHLDTALMTIGNSNCTSVGVETATITADHLRRALSSRAPSFSPTKSLADVYTPVDIDLLELWRTVSLDPDDEVIRWLREGAPAGLVEAIKDRGIFPTYSEEEDPLLIDADDLATEPAFTNYDGVDANPAVAEEVKRMHDANYVKQFAAYEDVVRYLGAEPVLSRIGVIERIRAGIVKHRIVINSKRSKVSAATRRFERTMLPRVLDVVYDALDLLATHRAEHPNVQAEIEFLIADFKDAFFIVPNSPSERRYFVVRFRGFFYVFLRTTQGSRGAPLTWGRVAAFLTRMTQSVIGTSTARISTYVDDPIIVSVGPKADRDLTFGVTLSLWSALGLPLSLSKAVRGETVTWTSASFEPVRTEGRITGIRVEVKKAIVEDVDHLTKRFVAANLVSLKDLRSYVGKLTHMASLVYMLRPFLLELYAALKIDLQTNAPAGSIWTKQIISSLRWISALIAGAHGTFARSYDLDTHLGLGSAVEVCLDASPWGLGGVLTIDGVHKAWFACPLSPEECHLLGIEQGSCTCQQIVESLAALVALRAWHQQWCNSRSVLKVRSDSVAALTITLRLKTKGRGTGIIAREMALDIALSCYSPHVAEHVPGTSNVLCDVLSRKYQPCVEYSVPAALSNVQETVLPPRTEGYFSTIGSPTSKRK